jgi:Ca2+-binding RTX toxin-like protein
MKNYSKLVIFAAISLALTTAAISSIVSIQNSAWGLTILCNFPSPTFCVGTNGSDAMGGDGQNNDIDGCGGNDIISGGPGSDHITGDGLKSNNGCPSGGQYGLDRITGGPGDDNIFHAEDVNSDQPDGHRDMIDCGPGVDDVFINLKVDHDIALNCENFHTG